MKVRIGYGLGTTTAAGGRTGFTGLVDALERHGYDSLWLSERITGSAPDPVVGLAVAAGRTEKLKLGTSVLVLPGRNPAVLAGELATLDLLSGGRFLPAFGLGVADGLEQQAFAVDRKERAPWFDEALPLLRRWWRGEAVDHQGPRFTYAGLAVQPRPVGKMEVWLGGAAPSELRRVGRLGDGWLPSFTTPEKAAEGRTLVEATAAEHERAIDPEHFGALIPYLREEGPVPAPLAAVLDKRAPGVDPSRIVPAGHAAVARLCQDFVDAGFSKLVLVPIGDAPDWDAELGALAEHVRPLEA